MILKPHATIEKLRSGTGVTIAAIGDSLTYGWMVRKGYVDFLEEMLRGKYPESRLSIVGSGIPGDTADSGLSRLQEDVLDEEPDCILVQYAINDAECGFTVSQFRYYIQEIIGKIRRTGDADIVLVTSIYIENERGNQLVAPYYRQLEALGEANGLPVARVHTYWKKKIEEGIEFLSLVQGDRVHPTVAGYQLMAEAIMKIF